MKFNCDLYKEWQERSEEAAYQEFLRQLQWHTIRAWRPRKVGPKDCRWLERIERRVKPTPDTLAFPRYCLLFDKWTYEYRALAQSA